MEFERLRHTLGFAQHAPRLIDGRYRVNRTLGRGAMGEVLLVYDHRLEREVALKLVRASVRSRGATLQARLKREALALARIDHANVISVHDVGSSNDSPYFTMQYAPGVNLREWQQQRSRSVDELIGVYLQAARGLEAAHRGGVIHRDFKPDNVLVGDDGIVRVLDFGIAAALRPDLDELGDSAERGVEGVDTTREQVEASPTELSRGAGLTPMTRAGALLGTLPYMAPEQLLGRLPDASSDQFGFCVALWEALTGTRPFAGRSASHLLESIDAGPVGAGELPRWLRPMLTRGIAAVSSARWSSMTELIAAIEHRHHAGRRLGVAGVLGLSLVVAVVLGRSSVGEQPLLGQSCADYLATVDASWTAERRALLVERAKRAQLESSGRYVESELDALAASWKMRALQRCEGERRSERGDPAEGSGAWAPAEDTRARVCLDEWVERFEATIELLVERGDERTLSRAPDLLARLVPPAGDDCSLRPEQPIDPEVWRLAERSEALISIGDMQAASAEAELALARAGELAKAPYDLERGVAHLARGRVAAYERDFARARSEIAAAERHALGSGAIHFLLSVWTLAAKVEALAGRGELGQAFATRGEPLSEVLGLSDKDPRRAELYEAHGLSARKLGEHEQALLHHRAARALFEAAGQPTLAAKSLINIGANLKDLERFDAAAAVYAEALVLLNDSGVPQGYPSRVRLARDLGLLLYQVETGERLRPAYAHFEFVAEHGTRSEVIDAHELMIAIARYLGETERARAVAEAALALLDEDPDIGALERARIRGVAGLALADAGDPRGEPLLARNAAEATALGPGPRAILMINWIDWLEQKARCNEARTLRRELAAEFGELDEDNLPPEYTEWIAEQAASACTHEASTRRSMPTGL